MNVSSIHVVGSSLYTFSLVKFTASWEIMLGLQAGILLDDGLNNVAVKIGSIMLALAHGNLYTPFGGGVGFTIGGTIFGVLARVLRRCARGFALRVRGAVRLVDVVMIGDDSPSESVAHLLEFPAIPPSELAGENLLLPMTEGLLLTW